jgi:D-serine deaminase-like pyridoxal phosphate-dependent protein
MRLADLPTPCLVLDRGILQRNLARMAAAAARHLVPLRPHMKTSKSIDVARLALADQPGGIAVSTLAEAEYFAAHGIVDILYTVAVTPQKLDQVDKLNVGGAAVMVMTDDPATAAVIAAQPRPPRTLIEVDCGGGRGGVPADGETLPALAEALGPALFGVATHAGEDLDGRGPSELRRIAEAERTAVTRAAERLRATGRDVPIVSMGGSPAALHAASLHGVTELCAGAYMFGDLFQAGLVGVDDVGELALTVLASVVGRGPGRLLIDAGAIALSKDCRTRSGPVDRGHGLVLDLRGRRAWGDRTVGRVWQEHGVIADADAIGLPVGGRVRIAPSHAALTAAAHDRYYVVDGDDEVIDVWTRVNGW